MKPAVTTEADASVTEYDSAFSQGLVGGEAFQPKNDAIALPADWVIKDVNEYAPTPRRKKATVTLRDAPSLISYLERFGTQETVLFASREHNTIEAIVDFHGAPSDGNAETSPGNASWCCHRATLKLQKSSQWNRWFGKHDKAIAQSEFADLIDDSAMDFIAPTAAELLDIVSDVREAKKVEFTSAKNIQNGLVEFAWKETDAGGGRGSVKIPKEFNIAIPVYVTAAPVPIKVRLRYRISDGGVLTFTFIMDQIDRVLEEAFDDVSEIVASGVTHPVYNGTASV